MQAQLTFVSDDDEEDTTGFSMKISLKKDVAMSRVLKAFSMRLEARDRYKKDLPLLLFNLNNEQILLSAKASEVFRTASQLIVRKDFFGLGVSCLQQNDLETALNHFMMCRRQYKNTSTTWREAGHNIVLVYASQSHWKAGLAVAKETAQVRNDAESWYEVGTIAKRISISEACQAYTQALDVDPRHIPSYVSFVQLLHGKKAEHIAAKAIRHKMIWSHPEQRPPFYFPSLETKPWYSSTDFSFCALLKESAAQIRDEFLKMNADLSHSSEVGHRSGFAHDSHIKLSGSWREAVFLANHSPQNTAETQARFPFTTYILTKIPQAISCAELGCGESLFSVLAPGTRLRPHCGSTNARLTCHLPIIVPPHGDVSIRCGQERRKYLQDEPLVFDDSFEHEVHNLADGIRVVLLINFWHHDFLPSPDWRQRAQHSSTLAQYAAAPAAS